MYAKLQNENIVNNILGLVCIVVFDKGGYQHLVFSYDRKISDTIRIWSARPHSSRPVYGYRLNVL